MAAYTGVFKTWSNVYNGSYLFSYFLSHVNYFCKKAPYRCSAGLEIGFCLRVWNIELTLVPSLQIKPKKNSARKYVWHRFWKGERSSGTVHRMSVWRRSRPKGSFKKVLQEISQNSQENIFAGISFFFGVFLWILKHFLEHLFGRTVPDDYFWL